MTNKIRRNKKKSLCEKSMKLVVSIAKQSYLSLATLSLRTVPVKLPAAERIHVPESDKLAAIMDGKPMAELPSGRQLSQEQEGRPKPEEAKSMSTFMTREVDDINMRASDFIRRIHEKNRNVPNNESKDLSYVMPPPPSLAI